MGRKITILVLGSRGDVRPFVPLGQAFQRVGHHMRVATFTAFAPLIQRAGLTFAELPGDAQALLRSATQGDQLYGHSPVNTIRTLARHLQEAIAALDDMQLVLDQLPSFLFGGDLAEHLGVPWAVVVVLPIMRTRFRPLWRLANEDGVARAATLIGCSGGAMNPDAFLPGNMPNRSRCSSLPIVKMMNADHLSENLRATEAGPLPADVYTEAKR